MLIWGAGATVDLGLQTTAGTGTILSRLAGIGKDDSLANADLRTRIQEAFKDCHKVNPELLESLRNLLILLFDGDGAKNNNQAKKSHSQKIKDIISMHGQPGCKKYLRETLLNLHHMYDWIGVRSIAKYIARKYENAAHYELDLQDLLTTVDQLQMLNLAIPTEELFYATPDPTLYMIGKERLIGVRNCLIHLMTSISRILIQGRPGRLIPTLVKPYMEIFNNFANLMKHESDEFWRRKYQADSRRFYLNSTAIISFNWDPSLLWFIFNANKDLNDLNIPLKRGSITRRLRFFNDLGDGIGVRKILDKRELEDELFALMMNEQACRAINNRKYNSEESRVMRIGKILFPHAGFGWRACRRCGRIFIDFGPRLDDIYSSRFFGPDLLPELNVSFQPRTEAEEEEWCYGNFGAIQCVFCGNITHPSDCPIMLQSGIKSERHYVLDGILREMGLLIGNAKHLVFAGYSIPRDDYIYRCFFQSAKAGKQTGPAQFCSLVLRDVEYIKTHRNPWLDISATENYLNDSSNRHESNKQVIRNFLQVFSPHHFRLSLLGIPNVITKHPFYSTQEALKELLYPKDAFTEGFPPNR